MTKMVSRLGLCDKRCMSYLCIAKYMMMNVYDEFSSFSPKCKRRKRFPSKSRVEYEISFLNNLSRVLIILCS